MNRQEHLLTCLAEECTEVGKRVSKALRFGLDEVQRDQSLTNRERVVEELVDLIAVAEICRDEGLIRNFFPLQEEIIAKRAKIERYMRIAREQGVLQDGEGA